MQYSDVLKFLYGRAIIRKGWDLKNIKKLLKLLGNPERNLKVIHITGTNGKGSTTTMISSILKEAGYKTGMYISPHIDDFRERITVNGKYIPKSKVIEIFSSMISYIDKFGKSELSFFEITTAIAYVYFRNENIDYVVLETGLGGRLDATNVCKSLVSVITNVDIEHTQYLGKTAKSIAREKAGIIKRNSVLVTAEMEKEILDIFRKICTKRNTRMIQIGKDMKEKSVICSAKKNVFKISGKREYVVDLSLLGKYQGLNAASAVAVAEVLGIEQEDIEAGLKKAWLPARLEIVDRKPLVIMDSAHNPAAMKNLSKSLEMFRYQSLVVVIGIMNDKDIGGIISQIGKKADVMIINKPDVYRSAEPLAIAEYASKLCKKVIVENDVRKSVKLAKAIANKDDLVLITGSMYMISEARKRNLLRVAQ